MPFPFCHLSAFRHEVGIVTAHYVQRIFLLQNTRNDKGRRRMKEDLKIIEEIGQTDQVYHSE